MPVTNPGGASNDKVTLALLVQRLDALIIRLERLDEKLSKYIETNDLKSNIVNIEIERLKNCAESLEDDLAAVKRKLETWNILNSIAAAIAVILSIVLVELLK